MPFESLGGLTGLFSQIGPILILVAIIAAFYFFAIRPQQKKDKQVKEMRNTLSTGDRVTTIGGLFGRVVDVKDDVVTLEFGPAKTVIMVARWAVGSVEGGEEQGEQLEAPKVEK